MTVGSLFSGVGGFDLGLERAGHRVVWQVEIDPFCRAVLAKHWPDVPCYEDVHDVGAHNLAPVDLICGGFPCQPVSVAGKQLAQDDPRWLWPEFARILGELRPRYALVENVPGLLVRGMGDVLGDLAALGYDAEWQSLPAAAFGAPHLRWRVWILAHAHGESCRLQPERLTKCGDPAEPRDDGATRSLADPDSTRQLQPQGAVGKKRGRPGDSGQPLADPPSDRRTSQGKRTTAGHAHGGGELQRSRGTHWDIEPDVGRVADGVPSRLDRLRALGNAIVPQVAEWIGQRLALTPDSPHPASPHVHGEEPA